jgi:excisionase family DNA binding protein
MDPTLHTVEEVAQRLKLHVRTVRQYLRSGQLKGTRIGKQYRITQADLEAFGGAALATAGKPVQRHRSVHVSSVVEITAIDRDKTMRMTNALVAAANSNRGDEPPLRVETIYDEQAAVLKVILIGGGEATSHLLRMINLYTEH